MSRPSSISRRGSSTSWSSRRSPSCGPPGEEGLVAARRVFADGRTRAYAWGRAVPREDLAALVERLLAMSGQFEQRRLARPSHQLDVLDAFVGEEQLRRRSELQRAWRELVAARRRREELAGAAAGRAQRLAELAELVARTEGIEPGDEERLLAERERLRHVTELAEAAAAGAEALDPEQADVAGAATQVAEALRALEGAAALAPELGRGRRRAGRGRDSRPRGRLDAPCLPRLARSRAGPAGGRRGRARADRRRAPALRRFRHGGAARPRGGRHGPSWSRSRRASIRWRKPSGRWPTVEERVESLATALATARAEAAEPFAEAVVSELRGLGMGDGEFTVELAQREPGPAGRDGVSFLVRPNPGLPFAPAAETASGGELSRIALALRAVAHASAGEPTVVFDEIDAGIGGRTAHAVADALGRLAERAQLLTITHLPQIASVAERAFPGREGAGRPHAHADPEAFRTPSGGKNWNVCWAVPSSSPWCARVDLRRVHRNREAGQAYEAPRPAPRPRRHRDHRPSQPRHDLGRGAARERGARRRERLAVVDRRLSERRAAHSCRGRRLPDRRARRRALRGGEGRRVARRPRLERLPQRLTPRRGHGSERSTSSRATSSSSAPASARRSRHSPRTPSTTCGKRPRSSPRACRCRSSRRASATGTRSSSRAAPRPSATSRSSPRTSATSGRSSSAWTEARTRSWRRGTSPT